MWLINTDLLKLETVVDPDTPGYRYAILSHTWEDGEVTFQDMADIRKAKNKAGFFKIARTCQLAAAYGLRYAWVDTCCIDKSSSAELTEAINSMFQWYKKSTICFVYLSDLPNYDSKGRDVITINFPSCRWFTRGWTLQELIASPNVIFYDQIWNEVGTKSSLLNKLHVITGIDLEVLRNSNVISTICLAKRMSWAAKRQTTRVEDLSYCLFGIFDVNLPLIYGEGTKAFNRLQEAIVSNSNDLSLFAWTAQDINQDFRGIFALNPSEFLHCGSYRINNDPTLEIPEIRLTNKGLHVKTRLNKGEDDYQLSLHCFDSKFNLREFTSTVVLALVQTAQGYVRHKPYLRFNVGYSSLEAGNELPIFISKTVDFTESKILSTASKHRVLLELLNPSYHLCQIEGKPAHLWDNNNRAFVTEGNERFTALLNISLGPPLEHMTPDTIPYSFFYRGFNRRPRAFVVLGLKVRTLIERVNESEYSAQEVQLEPWAAIYKHDSQDEVSLCLSEENRRGSINVLSRLRELVLSRFARDTVSFVPDSGNNDEEVYDTIRLSVSTQYEESNNRGMYKVVLKVESLHRFDTYLTSPTFSTRKELKPTLLSPNFGEQS